METVNCILFKEIDIDELDEYDFKYPIGIQEAANHIGISYSILRDSVIASNTISDYYFNCKSIGSPRCEAMQ
jgi:hypothetical protein